MENREKILAVQAWQENEHLHPLTCGNDSKHEVLKPVEEAGGVA